ncbi:MAG: UDP-N-acetylmuramate dehydrogenase [Acidobacteria bacterium]|nr:UDP-N-acetylmuramate dehydrogenase [Acidobacteriota bacterium]
MTISLDRLRVATGADRVRANVMLAALTSFGIGGPADYLFDAQTTEELLLAVTIAREDGVPVTLVGGGSNILVADRGIRGLVIRVRTARIERVGDGRVSADAGVTSNGLVRWTIARGLGGLESWAGLPGTIGGAIWGNAHYAGRVISESVCSVSVLGLGGSVTDVAPGDMMFGYGTSRLQTSGEILLGAAVRVVPDRDPSALRTAARQSLLHRKQTQPLHMRSAGCVFQNPDPARDDIPGEMPWSAGALIDRAGLKGRTVGGACVSPVHANFIVNQRGATAADVRQLIEMCRRAVFARFGVQLREEIRYLGDFQ